MAKYFGLSGRVGPARKTNIGYDVYKAEMLADRTSSGDVGFHEKNASEHRTPLPLPLVDGRMALHIFLDRLSVEVFGWKRGTNLLASLAA